MNFTKPIVNIMRKILAYFLLANVFVMGIISTTVSTNFHRDILYAVTFASLVLFFIVYPRSGKSKKSNKARNSTSPMKRYKSLANFADMVESNPDEIDANIKAVFTDLYKTLGYVYDKIASDYGREILASPVTALKRIVEAPIEDKAKPVISSLFTLADMIEGKETSLDPSMRVILTEIYDYCEIYTAKAEEDCELSPLSYDLERILYPRGASMSQSEAAARRQSKMEAVINEKIKTQCESTHTGQVP